MTLVYAVRMETTSQLFSVFQQQVATSGSNTDQPSGHRTTDQAVPVHHHPGDLFYGWSSPQPCVTDKGLQYWVGTTITPFVEYPLTYKSWARA